MSATQIEELVSCESPSKAEDAKVKVVKEGNRFYLTPADGAYEPGATYTITLNSDNLSFTGEKASAYQYNICIKMPDTYKVELDSDLIYILSGDISNVTNNGGAADILENSMYELNATNGEIISNYKNGTFTYTKSKLHVCNKISVYSGVRPDKRKLNEDYSKSPVAYVTITKVDNTTYSYKMSEADGDFEIEEGKMDYSDSKYEQAGLDKDTTIDKCDFITFYKGDLGTAST